MSRLRKDTKVHALAITKLRKMPDDKLMEAAEAMTVPEGLRHRFDLADILAEATRRLDNAREAFRRSLGAS